MLESIFILLLVLAVIFLIVAIEWESFVMCAIDFILWLVLALGVLDIEVPYQYVSGGVVTTAMHSMEGMHYLAMLFAGIGVVVFIYFVTMVLDTLAGKSTKGI